MDAIQIAEAYFPGSMSLEDALKKVAATLQRLGLNEDNTILARSVSPNIVHRDSDIRADNAIPHKGDAFYIGGLAGIPFNTSTIASMSKSFPDDHCHCTVKLATHLGISENAPFVLGKSLDELGETEEDACAATNALAHCIAGNPIPNLNDSTAESFQMDYIINEVSNRVSHLNSITGQNAKQAELAQQMWDIAKLQLENQLEKVDLGGKDSKLIVFTGIRINMPGSYSDYFFPMSFELHLKNGVTMDLFEETFRHTAPAEFRDIPSQPLCIDLSTTTLGQSPPMVSETTSDYSWRNMLSYITPNRVSVGAAVGTIVAVSMQVLTSAPVMKTFEIQRHNTQGY